MAIEIEEVDNLLVKESFRMRTSVNLLGCGGVGSNILRFARREEMTCRYTFRLYDMDEVELHNLNRTSLFHLEDINKKKTNVLRSNFMRYHHSSRSYGQYHDPTTNDSIRDTFNTAVDSESELYRGLIVDARDTVDPSKVKDGTWIKLAYNGASEISFHFKPHLHSRMILNLGDDGYEVVPSFYVPAAMLSVMMWNFARYVNLLEITNHRAGVFAFDFDDTLESLMEDYDAVE
jgi:hypothetical protein